MSAKEPGVGKHRAKGGSHEESALTDRVVLCVAVCAPSRDQMNDPA